MKNIRDTCIELFQNEDIRRDVKEIIKPLANMIYAESYLYIWFICIFCVFLLFMVITNLILVLKLIKIVNKTMEQTKTL
jgi:hypothetical protein